MMASFVFAEPALSSSSLPVCSAQVHSDANSVVRSTVCSSTPSSFTGLALKGIPYWAQTLPAHLHVEAAVSVARPRNPKSAASTSAFKGVTKHKGTGKFEAHLWDSSHVRIVKVRAFRKMHKLFVAATDTLLQTASSSGVPTDSLYAAEKGGKNTRQANILRWT